MIEDNDVILLCGEASGAAGPLAHAIRMHNLTVDFARDGVEALDRISRRTFSVLVIDDAVVVNETPLISYLSKTRPELLARVIVVSTGASGLHGRAIPPDVFARVNSPVDAHAVVAAIRECSRRGRSHQRIDSIRPRRSPDDSAIRP